MKGIRCSLHGALQKLPVEYCAAFFLYVETLCGEFTSTRAKVWCTVVKKVVQHPLISDIKVVPT